MDDIANRLVRKLTGYYDVVKLENDLSLYRCELHVSNQKFFLFKENVIWEANCHEYVYIFETDLLSLDKYREYETYVANKETELITPNKNHMYTYLTAIVICDKAGDDAKSALKKCNIRKDYKFSLHGWMEVHTALYESGSGGITTNRAARELKKLFESI